MLIQTLGDTDRFLRTVPERDRLALLAQIKKKVVRYGAAKINKGVVEAPPPPEKPAWMTRGFDPR